MTRFGMASILLLLAAFLGCGPGEGKAPSWTVRPSVPAGTDLEQVFRHNNLGVAHLEQHHYGEAAVESFTGFGFGHWVLHFFIVDAIIISFNVEALAARLDFFYR